MRAKLILTFATLFVFACSITALVIAAHSTQPTAPTPAPAAAPAPPAPRAAPTQRAAPRVRPAHTFDLLSEPVAPGASTTQTVTLADGWAVTGKPQVVGGGFVVDSAETSAAPDGKAKLYTVKARNDGKAAARFVADVPCSGCP